MISYQCKNCASPMRLGEHRVCEFSPWTTTDCVPVEAPLITTQSIDMKPLKCPCPLACSAEGCHGKCPGSTSRAYQMEKLKADMRTVPDATVAAVRAELLARSEVGLKKYGMGVADNPLSRKQWLQHGLEEALDLAVYLKRLIDMEEAA